MIPRCRSYPEDVALSELRTAEQFAVTTLRLWVECHIGKDDRADWRAGLAKAGLGDHAAPAFNAIFLVMSTAALHPLDVRCRKCPKLGRDEALFLSLIGLLQRACMTGAELALRDWLPPAAVEIVLPFALAFAIAMAEQGLRVPRRPSLAALRHRFEGQRPSATEPRLALVH